MYCFSYKFIWHDKKRNEAPKSYIIESNFSLSEINQKSIERQCCVYLLWWKTLRLHPNYITIGWNNFTHTYVFSQEMYEPFFTWRYEKKTIELQPRPVEYTREGVDGGNV